MAKHMIPSGYMRPSFRQMGTEVALGALISLAFEENWPLLSTGKPPVLAKPLHLWGLNLPCW